MDHNTEDENQCQTIQVETKLEEAKQPERLGPYLIQELLGKGAMGEVFVAFHEKLKRKVALKVLPPFFNKSQMRIERFTREMAAVGRLDHPNVVRATDAGEEGGCQYIAMEYVHGADLQQLIGKGETLDVPIACEIIRQASMGLQHIRENDLVHRDIKPSNLMVTKEGVVKILDLGIARLRSDDELGTLTAEGGLMGTPDFIAPEQVTDCGCVDIRADIYSLGCTLYRLLAGNAPFDRPEYGTNMAKVIAHTQQTPECISKIVPDLPADLVKTIRRMMARDPKNRFQEPNQVVAAMCKWADATALPELVAQQIGEDAPSMSGSPQTAGLKAERISKLSFFKKFPQVAVIGAPIALGLVVALFAARRVRLTRGVAKAIPVTNVSSETTNAIEPLAAEQDRSPVPNTQQPTIAANGNPLELIAHNSGVTATATTEINSAVKNIDRSTLEISKTLKTLESSVRDLADEPLTAEDQLITDPKNDGEVYHNAKTLSRLGRNTEARASYVKLIKSGSPYVDVHQSFQEFAMGQLGLAGTRRIYDKHISIRNPTVAVAISMLLEPNEKRARLTRFVNKNPEFAPGIYELSKSLQNEDQTLAEKERELQLLKKVLRLHGEGLFLVHFLDKSAAGRSLQEIATRIRTLESKSQNAEPVRIAFLRHRRVWSANLQIAEPAAEIWYSLDGVDFTTTGEGRFFDQRIGKVAPRSLFSFPVKNPPNIIHVKYKDANGDQQGPFEIPFNAQQEAENDLQKKLKATKYHWVAFGGGDNSNRIYFTTLMGFRTLIEQVRYGAGVDQPNRTHHLPDNLSDAQRLYTSIPDDADYVVVQLEFKDGRESEIVRIDR